MLPSEHKVRGRPKLSELCYAWWRVLAVTPNAMKLVADKLGLGSTGLRGELPWALLAAVGHLTRDEVAEGATH
jgi:hypothetical protein